MRDRESQIGMPEAKDSMAGEFAMQLIPILLIVMIPVAAGAGTGSVRIKIDTVPDEYMPTNARFRHDRRFHRWKPVYAILEGALEIVIANAQTR
jgi:hypothetical protein